MAEKAANTPASETGPTPPARGWDLFSSLHNEADRLFREFSKQWPTFEEWPALTHPDRPAADVVDLGKRVEVRIEVPGIEEKDIDLEIDEHTLTLRAEKRAEKTEGEKGGDHYLSERRYGLFQRTVRLPETVDPEKAEAKLANGVLTVSFPKTRDATRKPKKVAVKKG